MLMDLHAAHGDRALALRAYHLCSSVLDRDLGAEPSAATQRRYRALLPEAPEPGPPGGIERAGAGSAPLVGRDPERARLGAAWRDARAGIARLVVVAGEPGVGKTRLVEEFRSWCARGGAVTAEARCYAAEGPLPYGLVVAWLRSPALRPRLAALDPVRLGELARLLPELAAEEPGLRPPEAVPEDEQRARVFEAVGAAVDLLGASLRGGPAVLLVADDLHHADRESCRLVHYLLRSRPTARLLVAATVRAGETEGGPVEELGAAMRERDRVLEIDLDRLDPAATAALLDRIVGGPRSGRVPAADASRLHAQTGGNPLFLVEAVRAGWRPESPRAPVTPRVQAVLAARMAQLTPASRELAAAAAVIGRPFDADLLAAAAWGEESGTAGVEDALVAGVDELWRRGILRDRGEAGYAGTYDFAHETLREAAAAQLSPVRRARAHRRVAAALERADPGGGARVAEIAAHHAQAGETSRAARWYLRAAQSAQLLYAHDESVRLLDRALDALGGPASDAARTELELEVRTALLAPLVSEHGYASPAVADVQSRLAALHRTLDVAPSAPLLRSLAMTALTHDDFETGRTYARRLLVAGEADATGVLTVEAEVLLGFAAFWEADFPGAAEHLGRAIAAFRAENGRTHLCGSGRIRRRWRTRGWPTLGGSWAIRRGRWPPGRPRSPAPPRSAIPTAPRRCGCSPRSSPSTWAMTRRCGSTRRGWWRRASRRCRCACPRRPCGATWPALDGDAGAGLALIGGAMAAAARGAGAPGMRAILARIELAACVATGDPTLVAQAAERLLAAGPAAAVWAPAARSARGAFRPAEHRGAPTEP